MSSLVELTDVAKIHILERCDFGSLMTLRQVCKSLRQFISDSHLKTNLIYFYVDINPSHLKIRWKTKCFKITPGKPPFKTADDFTSSELRTILSIQNSKLDTFQVIADTDQSEILEDLEDILESRPHPLQAEKLMMSAMGIPGFMKVLPYLDSKKIELSFAGWGVCHLNRIEKLLKTEQFKEAEVFKISGFVVKTELKKFYHLQVCELALWRVSEEDVRDLKETFLTSTHMRNFTLRAFNLTVDVVEKMFGSPSWDSIVINGILDDGKTWYFKLKNCKEHLLEMKFQAKQLHLRKVEKSGVSDQAIIIRV